MLRGGGRGRRHLLDGRRERERETEREERERERQTEREIDVIQPGNVYMNISSLYIEHIFLIFH